MRIYLAAPWDIKERAKAFADRIEATGHEITHKWWDYEGDDEAQETPEFMAECAKSDRNGVFSSHMVVVINERKSEGKAVEQGLALGANIPIMVIGDKEKKLNIFQYLGDYTWVKDEAEALGLFEFWAEVGL